MNYRLLAQSALFLALACPAASRAELPTVTVRVTNVASTSGTVEVSIFDSEETFLRRPYLQRSGKVTENGRFETVFAALPAGDYAVVVVHDANDNHQFDQGILGFGSEDYGYSNNVRTWFFRPDFDDVKFTLDNTPVLVEIDLD